MADFEGDLAVVPFGSRTLRLTWPYLTGTDVKVLQRIYDTMLDLMNPATGPIGPRIPITGVFDRKTAQAVRAIQTYFGIPPSGEVGRATYRVFGQLPDAYGGPAFGSRPLKEGDTGGDVTVLQNRLNCLRYATILGHPADGNFSATTRSALAAFQADNVVFRGWQIDWEGSAEFDTFDILWIVSFLGGRNLHEGAHGFDAAALQVILRNLELYSGRVDGFFGAKTRRAVMAFQARAGLTPDGVVNPRTYHQLGLANPVFWYSVDRAPRESLHVLNAISVVGSTVDPINRDQHPCGIAIAPYTYDDSATVLKGGELLVSNGADAQGNLGRGTTLVRLVKGAPVRFFGQAPCPVALAISNLGPPWVADFGPAPDGSQGLVQVLTPDGALFSGGEIRRPGFQGLWGIGFNFGPLYGLPAAFFCANALSGTLDRLTNFHPPDFNATTTVTTIASQLPHLGKNVDSLYGPQGMVWVPMGDTLYIANGADHRISQWSGVSTTSSDLGPGQLVYHGRPLNRPAGLAFNPENGNLLAVNQGDNRVVEINPRSGQVVGFRLLDRSPVNPGQRSALWGAVTAVDDRGDVVLYFTNAHLNTVNRLSRG
ncbi:MAG: peptidoglycan-binding protein [Firmicutes bacterium]|nr:peptidoglycan-binding protein [Bacillota bacterium]